MANEPSASEGASLLKRIKITKAQRTMFIFVCFASLILGVTSVLCIYFGKKIIFYNKLNKQKTLVVESLDRSAKNLSGLNGQIDALSTNEYLESVRSQRSDNDKACEAYRSSGKVFGTGETKEEVELARRCTSLRVINDAMPSTSSTVKFDDVRIDTHIQFSLLMHESDVDKGENALAIEEGGSSTGYADTSSDSLIQPYSSMAMSVNVTDDITVLSNFLTNIDKSVRNFDLRSLTLVRSEESTQVEFTGEYNAYYTNPVDLKIRKRTICADAESSECTASGGDQSIVNKTK